jgi:hypothetical protein
VKSSFVILKWERGESETSSCYSYTLKRDNLEDQLFDISAKGLLDGQPSFLGGVPLVALFSSCVEERCDAGGVGYIL